MVILEEGCVSSKQTKLSDFKEFRKVVESFEKTIHLYRAMRSRLGISKE